MPKPPDNTEYFAINRTDSGNISIRDGRTGTITLLTGDDAKYFWQRLLANIDVYTASAQLKKKSAPPLRKAGLVQ